MKAPAKAEVGGKGRKTGCEIVDLIAPLECEFIWNEKKRVPLFLSLSRSLPRSFPSAFGVLEVNLIGNLGAPAPSLRRIVRGAVLPPSACASS